MELTYNKEILEILEQIIMCRPVPIRKYDQIYMKMFDMHSQAMMISPLLKNRRVVFLGDGDAMSLFFLRLMQKEIIPYASELKVLDFDERIINNFKRQFKIYEEGNINLSAELYNVINPLPQMNKYDFFYINPPYGSKNSGKSCMAWIYRCMELCSENSYGCIILPYVENLEWTMINIKNIEKFLLENGFIISNIIPDMHLYHLDDNPTLVSCSILVKRVKNIASKYINQLLPEEMIKNLYGNPRKLPQYIYDNGSLYGKEDFDWIYGTKEY